MEDIREYLLSVNGAALLCSIITALTPQKGSQAGIVKLICGLFLCFTVLSPILEIRISDLPDLASDLLAEGEAAALDGEEESARALRRIITEETEAYIMDKAQQYGASVTPKVTLSDTDPPVPNGCTLSGSVSPYVRQQLKKILEADLGIPEENQTWIN